MAIKKLPFLAAIVLSLPLFSQQIKVVDAVNNLPIPNAHICTESVNRNEIHYWVTNLNGLVTNSLKSKSKAAISFIGYKTLIDSIQPNKSYTFILRPNTESISEVVITGQIIPKTVDQSIYNVQVIDSKQIKNKAANNLADLLSNELNISIGNNGILGSSIQMQGLSGEHIKILVDGVPVIGRQNGNIDLGQLNIQNIDHVEIIEGPMSVVYGSNALAGAINLITQNNSRARFKTSVNTYYESVGVYNFGINASTRINKHHLSLSGSRNFFGGYSTNNIYPRTFDFYPKEQYSGTIKYKFSNKKLTTVLSQEVFAEKLIDYGLQFEQDRIETDSGYYAYPMAYDEYHNTKRLNSKATLEYKLNSESKINFMAAYSTYQKQKRTFENNLNLHSQTLLANSDMHDTTGFYNIISRGTYALAKEKIELQSGYELVHETGTGKRISETKQMGDYATFISLIYAPIKTLSFQGGTRLIYNTKFNAPVVYSINTKWQPNKKINIRASYGKGFRSPSIKELYLNFIDVNHEVLGNENLKAEHSQNYNLNFEYSEPEIKHSFNCSLKLYYNSLKTKIDFLYDSVNTTKANYYNIDGQYKTLGGQFELTYKLHPKLVFKTGINYYGNSKMVNLEQFTFTPDYSAMINYHNIAYQFRINLYYKYNGKKSQYYESTDEDKATIEERYLAAYNMLNLTLSKPFFNEKLNLVIGAKNLLNVKMVEGSGYSSDPHGGNDNGSSNVAWGRTFFIKLKYTFAKF